MKKRPVGNTMGKATLLRSQLAPLFVARAKARGVVVDDILRRHGLRADVAEQPTIPIALETFRELAAELAERAGDPHFGFHTALEMPKGSFGIIEYVVRSSPTVSAIIEQLVRYGRMINGQVTVTFDAASGRVQELIPGEPGCLGPHGNEFSMGHQIKIARELTGEAFVPLRVYLAHPRAADDAELVRYFGCGIDYVAGFNGLDLPQDFLETRVKTADPALLALLESRARAVVEELSQGDDLAPLREALVEYIAKGEPSAPHLAKAIGVSERTLHRRLREANTSLREMIDEVRKKMALAHLEDPRRSIVEVAIMVGYSDQRAFARAFQRWTGQTPTEYRKRISERR